MSKVSLIVIVKLMVFNLFAQNQNNTWIFGEQCALTFSNPLGPQFFSVTTTANNPPFYNNSLFEGSASVSNRTNGNLLFFTNGQVIFNKLFDDMPNGQGLSTEYFTNQSALIVPRPFNKSQYYVFTTTRPVDQFQISNIGIRYSIVDMSLDGGLGDVVPSTKNTLLVNNSVPKITVAKAADSVSYWIITHDITGNAFRCYRLNACGIDTIPVVSNVGVPVAPFPSSTLEPNGSIVINSQFNKIAMANGNNLNSVELFDFNPATGIISNPVNVPFTNVPGPGATVFPCYVEFSPNGNLLYISGADYLFQLNASAATPAAILASLTLIDFAPFTYNLDSWRDLRLAPNGKIYLQTGQSPVLSVINNPNALGLACNFVPLGLLFTNSLFIQDVRSGFNLPPRVFFLKGAIKDTIKIADTCFTNATSFSISGLTSSNIQSVQWNFGNAASPTNTSSLLAPTHVYTAPGNYSAQAIINYTDCRTDTLVRTITIKSVVLPTITVNSPVCQTGVLNLNGSAATSHSWSGPASFASNLQNPSLFPLSLNNSGVYTLSILNNGCVSSQTANVMVIPSQPVSIQSSAIVCLNKTITLIAGVAAVSYTWNGPNNFNSNTQSVNVTNNALPINAGSYNVSVTYSNGCKSTGSFFVNVVQLPVVSASVFAACINQSIALQSFGASTYTWQGPQNFSSKLQNPVISNAQLSMNGIYSVTANDLNNCTNTATTSVALNPLPTPTISSNSPVCAGGGLDFFADGGTSYLWQGSNGFVTQLEDFGVIANTNYAGTYTLTATDQNNCKGIATLNVDILPQAVLSINSNTNQLCSPACFTLNAESSALINRYIWSVNNIGISPSTDRIVQCFNTAGTYTIKASGVNSNGCVALNVYTLLVNPRPNADFNFETEIDDLRVKYNALSRSSNSIVSWDWFFTATDENQANGKNAEFIFPKAGNYLTVLIATTDKGCMDTILKPIIIEESCNVYTPNTFTPNSDGLNDVFKPATTCIFKAYDIEIYDRWGQKLFRSNDINIGWDGSFKGEDCKHDMYAYKVQYQILKQKLIVKTGHVYLLR